MTFGEKLKEARKQEGLSQEQLSQKLSVSRSAIAKWESDKGMPDIENLKMIAQALDISIDYLLDDGKMITFNEIKEPINLNDYEKEGPRKNKYDAVCLHKHADATSIRNLVRNKKMNKKEWWADFIVFPGIVNILDKMNNNAYYYLVEKNNKNYLVSIDDEFMTTVELKLTIEGKKFVVGDDEFMLGYKIK